MRSSAGEATTSFGAGRGRTASAGAGARTASSNEPAADEEERDQESDHGERRVEPEAGLDAVGERRDRRVEDGRRQSQADRAAGDLKHVDDAAGQAGLRFVDRGDPGG